VLQLGVKRRIDGLRMRANASASASVWPKASPVYVRANRRRAAPSLPRNRRVLHIARSGYAERRGSRKRQQPRRRTGQAAKMRVAPIMASRARRVCERGTEMLSKRQGFRRDAVTEATAAGTLGCDA